MEEPRDRMDNLNEWVLLVEDNDDEANLAQRAFKRVDTPAEVVVASDASQAVALLEGRSQPPHVAFLDMRLPGMSGLELLKWIRSQPNLKGVPVVMLVGSGDNNLLLQAADSGANSLVRKEVDYDLYMQNVGLAYRYWMCVHLSLSGR